MSSLYLLEDSHKHFRFFSPHARRLASPFDGAASSEGAGGAVVGTDLRGLEGGRLSDGAGAFAGGIGPVGRLGSGDELLLLEPDRGA